MVSIIILFLAFRNNDYLIGKLFILGIIVFLGIALRDHFYEVKDLKEDGSSHRKKINMGHIKILLGTILSAAITWYIHHELGHGPIIANGFIGVLVAVLFAPKEAGAYYAASFVGMSGQGIVPSMAMAGLIGLFAGVVILLSQEIYAGIGGKGGTTVAFSTQLVRIILSFFI